MNRALLVLLDPIPRVRLTDCVLPGQVRVFGRRFSEILLGSPGQVGFFDWLRLATGEVIGLRLLIHDNWIELLRHIPPLPYVQIFGEGVIEILFRDGAIDPELSVDQAFDEVRAYLDADGVLLLGIDIDGLSPTERVVFLKSFEEGPSDGM